MALSQVTNRLAVHLRAFASPADTAGVFQPNELKYMGYSCKMHGPR